MARLPTAAYQIIPALLSTQTPIEETMLQEIDQVVQVS
jgi:hypothetical protein